jgi:hypothetical protein
LPSECEALSTNPTTTTKKKKKKSHRNFLQWVGSLHHFDKSICDISFGWRLEKHFTGKCYF